MASGSFGFTSAQDTGSTISRMGRPLLCCCVVVIRVLSRETLTLPKLSRVNGGRIMAEKFTPYDPAEALDSLEAIEVYLADAFETGDASHIAVAFNDVARAKGMETLAERVGFSRELLHQSLSGSGNLTLESTLAILAAVGLTLTVAPAPAGVEEAKSSVPTDGDDVAVPIERAR
jgi:probable addiction module antidote protein